jgi:hypothetical protein
MTWYHSDIQARFFEVGRLQNPTTSGLGRPVSTLRLSSALPSNSSMTRPCKQWEIMREGRCSFWTWGVVSDRP